MRVTFLGTGLMGRPMARRLVAAGHQVTVYNRTREKAMVLEAAGARVAESAAQAVEASPCVVVMLADAAAIEAVLFPGKDEPALAGRTLIQMSTIAPSESKGLQKKVIEKGGDYLEAPVLGSTPEAESGKLLIMVGGRAKQFEQHCDLLRCLGPQPLLVGEVGKAAALKLAMNQLIAGLATTFALSLGFVQRQGMEVDMFMEILRKSALYAPMFDKKLQRMLERQYGAANFPSKHLHKDIELFCREAEPLGLDLASLEGTRQIAARALAAGLADADYAAIFDIISPAAAASSG